MSIKYNNDIMYYDNNCLIHLFCNMLLIYNIYNNKLKIKLLELYILIYTFGNNTQAV